MSREPCEVQYGEYGGVRYPGEEKGILYVDDLDDEELDAFILDEEESEAKARVWMEFNRDYLEKLAEKQREEEEGINKPKRKRKPRKKKLKPGDPAAAGTQQTTAAEAATEMMRKKFSRKINYAAIEGMLDSNNVIAAIERQKKGSTAPLPSAAGEEEEEVNYQEHGAMPVEEEAMEADAGGWEEGVEEEGFDEYE
ncbi:BRF1-domain-containing protein [Atractiella rhizophila]|nr:BRF1-domain-containing protein [Atractiella rhizophila]